MTRAEQERTARDLDEEQPKEGAESVEDKADDHENPLSREGGVGGSGDAGEGVGGGGAPSTVI